MKTRLDNYLVENKFFETRNKAQSEIKSGNIQVDKKIITKSGFMVDENSKVEIVGEVLPYVSKGGYKLEKAITEFGIKLTDKIMIDIGSSTGGFTDCALKNGAKKVYAIDVGTNQLHKSLLENKRVVVLEKTDFRNIDDEIIKDANFASIDISFISLTKIMNKLAELENLNEIVSLIKPQFECGKEIADKYRGVILNKHIHKDILEKMIVEFEKIGYNAKNLTFSPITGGNGNIEYLLHLKKNIEKNIFDLANIIDTAFNTLCKH